MPAAEERRQRRQRRRQCGAARECRAAVRGALICWSAHLQRVQGASGAVASRRKRGGVRSSIPRACRPLQRSRSMLKLGRCTVFHQQALSRTPHASARPPPVGRQRRRRWAWRPAGHAAYVGRHAVVILTGSLSTAHAIVVMHNSLGGARQSAAGSSEAAGASLQVAAAALAGPARHLRIITHTRSWHPAGARRPPAPGRRPPPSPRCRTPCSSASSA